MIPARLLLLLPGDDWLLGPIVVAPPAATLQITEIIGGWHIPGAAVGEAFTPGVSQITNTQLTGQGYSAGSTIGEGRQ